MLVVYLPSHGGLSNDGRRHPKNGRRLRQDERDQREGWGEGVQSKQEAEAESTIDESGDDE